MINVANDEAVEIVNDDGRLAVVIIQERKGGVRALVPGDPLFNGYCRTQRMSPAKVHIHEPFEGKPMPTV